MLDTVKKSMRPAIKTTVYDDVILDLIDAAKYDLKRAGVIVADEPDPLVRRAIVTYCCLNFGSPEKPELLKASYDEQKAQLATGTGYTDWGEDDEA